MVNKTLCSCSNLYHLDFPIHCIQVLLMELNHQTVVTTSTKGTAAITPLNKVGSKFTITPINNPPADPPIAYKCFLEVYFLLIRNFPHSIKSKNVFFSLKVFHYHTTLFLNIHLL